MEKRVVAYNLNIKNTSLKKAKKYIDTIELKYGIELKDLLPNFDYNYILLQKKLKASLDIPRYQMPVINSDDLLKFKQKLSDGYIDILKPFFKKYIKQPRRKSYNIKKDNFVEVGILNENKNNDVIRAKLVNIAVKKLFPTQSEVWLDKIIFNMIKFGVPHANSDILKKTIVVSGDYYILDGHHRYAQIMLANPKLKVNCLYIPLDIKKLLLIGKAYSEAVGNKPKAYIIAKKIVNLAKRILLEEENG